MKYHFVEHIKAICNIWKEEMKMVVKDQGVLLFLIIVPLSYPLLYSWIYNNEVAREVPVAAIDLSNSAMSRDFLRRCDATPDVDIRYHAGSMQEAKELMAQHKIWGIYLIPADFAIRIKRQEQTTVKVYCDMSIMLYYKALFQTATNVSFAINERIQTLQLHLPTSREEAIATHPLTFDEVALFNPSGGYGSFILPPVLILIIQQTMILGVGMAAGTRRDKYAAASTGIRQSPAHTLCGRTLCYFIISALVSLYLLVGIPRFFLFPALAGLRELVCMCLPLILSVIFFSISLSWLVRQRENVMLMVVFASVPLLFLSGISWPQSATSPFWQTFASLFPSTFGIRAFVRVNTMGASIHEISSEIQALWIQTVLYGLLAYLSTREEMKNR